MFQLNRQKFIQKYSDKQFFFFSSTPGPQNTQNRRGLKIVAKLQQLLYYVYRLWLRM